MTIPQQYGSGGLPEEPGQGGGWPSNELEETLAASLGVQQAGARLLEVLARSSLWVPLPEGGGPDSSHLDLPTVELGGAPYVPVFSSQEEFLRVAGAHLSFTAAPAREFARGLPPQVGIAINPGGAVGVPLPPEVVAELCANTPSEQAVSGVARGARMRLFEPDWQDDPLDFLSAAGDELQQVGAARSARRALASAEGDPPALYVGVELDPLDAPSRQAVHEGVGRALGRAPVKWPVQLVFLDAAEDPMVAWMRQCVRPFYAREGLPVAQ